MSETPHPHSRNHFNDRRFHKSASVSAASSSSADGVGGAGNDIDLDDDDLDAAAMLDIIDDDIELLHPTAIGGGGRNGNNVSGATNLIDDIDTGSPSTIVPPSTASADDPPPTIDNTQITQLFQSSHIEQIHAFIDANANELNRQQTVRCVLALWEFHKANTDGQRPVRLDTAHPSCDRLLERIAHFAGDMNPDELTISLLYLSKLGWDNQNATMQLLLDLCVERLADDDIAFPLTALSRFGVAVNAFKTLYPFFVCQDAFARMLGHMAVLQTSEELRLLTIGLTSMHQLVSADALTSYKERVRRLLETGALTADKSKCVLKVLQFLNYPHWSQRNTQLLRELVLLMKDRVAGLQVNELEQVFRVFQSQLEPAQLTAELTAHAQTLFERTPTAELLACSVMYALPDKRTRLTEYAREFIYAKDVPMQPALLQTLFKILRYLKISNVHICDGYWSKVMHEIRTNESEQQNYMLARHCHRYMHFNNNLGGTYHHREFEKYVTGLMVDEMRTGITAYIPGKFAKVAAFIIAYGHTPNGRQVLPEFVVCRLEDMAGQFKIADCLQISRGIQIALQMR